jgi:hypothetical protein
MKSFPEIDILLAHGNRGPEVRGEKRLAVNVITQALRDFHKAKPVFNKEKNFRDEAHRTKYRDGYNQKTAIWKRNKEDAETFLSGISGALMHWCDIIEVDPKIISQRFKNLKYKALPQSI